MLSYTYRNYQIVAGLLFIIYSIPFCVSMGKAETFCVNSSQDLQTVLSVAASNGENDTVQIVQGIYNGNFIYASTEPYNLSIEGGYETNCSSRVLDASNTVLDGSDTDNVLALSSNQEINFSVDGITLENGKAQTTNPYGGGLYVSTNQSMTLTNSIIDNNAAIGGGGVYIEPNLASQRITISLYNNKISNNSAYSGGGISAFGRGTITLSNNTISNNTTHSSGVGGGGYICTSNFTDSSIILVGNKIFENFADGNMNTSWTGGIWVGAGGMYIESDSIVLDNNTIYRNSANSGCGGVFVSSSKSIVLTNNGVVGNSADIGNGTPGGGEPGGGGGVYVYGTTTTSNIVITNNTFADNTAHDDAGGLMLGLREETAVGNIYNNIFWNNSASASSDIYLNNDGDNDFLPSIVNLFNNDFDQSSAGTFIARPFVIDDSNLDKMDPVFAGGQDYHLTKGSPCIDTGLNTAPSIPGIDYDGDSRILDGDNNGNAIVDMGADEYYRVLKKRTLPWIFLLLDEHYPGN